MSPTVRDAFHSMAYGPAPESAAPAIRWIAAHGPDFDHFINGRWHPPATSERFATFNPATSAPIATLAQAGEADVDTAVVAARSAFGDWGVTPGPVRARYLLSLAREIRRHHQLLATLATLDTGRPIRETYAVDIPHAIRCLEYHAGWAQLAEHTLASHEPVGVSAQISPWDSPIVTLARNASPALATGNTVILKPAELASLTALCFAQLCQDTGLPPGVVNVVTGDSRAGEALAKHPGVDQITFSGSVAVARLIRRATAGSGKALALELSGRRVILVFEDADVDSAVEGVVDAVWVNPAPACRGAVLLVQENIADGFLTRLRTRLARLRCGDPFDEGVDLGAVIDPSQRALIERQCAAATAEGATCWYPVGTAPTAGWFVPPTLCTDVAPSSTLAREALGAPIAVSLTFRSPAEAVTLANDMRRILTASVWSDDLNVALGVARDLQAWTVSVNDTDRLDPARGFSLPSGGEALRPYVRRRHWPLRNTVEQASDPRLRAARDTRAAEKIDVAVTAARTAVWATRGGAARAAVLHAIAATLAGRVIELAESLVACGTQPTAAADEVAAAVEAWWTWAAWCDTWDGLVRGPVPHGLALALREPMGVAGLVLPSRAPLLALSTLAGALLATGNTVVAVPSAACPTVTMEIVAALIAPDIPAGILSLVTDSPITLGLILAEHTDIDLLWCAGPAGPLADLEQRSAGNLKRTWTLPPDTDWSAILGDAAPELLGQATRVKHVWLPHAT